ncbi:helix-turn-helix domain-containing protein [Planctomicrobium sp. SH527]|uniref:helix-turn-helix domain-containing protein n=1 Tax=Planctomicrobium sp. SH527 TaxID=3448123 RepID=UPI003F5B196B
MALAKPDVIYQLHQAKGWSQERLAEKAGIDPKTASNVMQGRPCKISTLALIAQALGVEPSRIIQGDFPDPDSDTDRRSRSMTLKQRRAKARIRLDVDYNSYDELKDLSELIAVLMERIKAKEDVFVTDYAKGSVLVTLSMGQDDLEKLILAYLTHSLDDLPIHSITVLYDPGGLASNLPQVIDSQIREDWHAAQNAEIPPEDSPDIDAQTKTDQSKPKET